MSKAAKKEVKATETETYSATEICCRADEAHKRREVWKPVLKEAYEMGCPWRNPYYGDEARTKDSPPPLNHLYDSTMITSNFRATNRLLLDLVPPGQDWVDIKPGPVLEMMLNKSELEQLNNQIDRNQKILSMPFKGEAFINAIWEVLMDARTAGLGVLLVLENTDDDLEPVSFQTVPQSEVAVEVTNGQETGIFRTRAKTKVNQIKGMWKDAVLPQDLKDLVTKHEKKNPEVTLTEASYKDGNQWVYRVYWRAKKSDPAILVNRIYATNPWVLFPWSRIPGSEYGPGPVMMMLPDGRTANKVMEFLLKNAALALAGMYLVRDDGVINPDNVQIVAGGMIPVASTGGSIGASMVPLSTNREFNLGQIILDDLRTTIRKGLQDSGLPDPTGAVRSPTEIIERMRELIQENGGANGRLNSSLVKLVRRVADVMSRRGFIKPMAIDNFALKVQINSPLARSQQFQDVETVVKWIAMCKEIGGDQMTMLVAKLEEILVWMADQIGVPSELVRSETDRLQLKASVAKIVADQATTNMPGQPPAAMPAQAA